MKTYLKCSIWNIKFYICRRKKQNHSMVYENSVLINKYKHKWIDKFLKQVPGLQLRYLTARFVNQS